MLCYWPAGSPSGHGSLDQRWPLYTRPVPVYIGFGVQPPRTFKVCVIPGKPLRCSSLRSRDGAWGPFNSDTYSRCTRSDHPKTTLFGLWFHAGHKKWAGNISWASITASFLPREGGGKADTLMDGTVCFLPFSRRLGMDGLLECVIGKGWWILMDAKVVCRVSTDDVYSSQSVEC